MKESNVAGPSKPVRRVLVVRYDVTGLTDEEIGQLELEAVVQGESSDSDEDNPGHPDVPVTSEIITPDPA